MKPTHEIGKEAMEKLKAYREQARRRNWLTAIIIAVIVSVGVFYWTQLQGNSSTTAISMANQTPRVQVLKKWDMPADLREISGLSNIDEHRFACVQDELGTVFIYNTQTSKVEKEIGFAGPGDYEGLAVVNDNIWVVRADGRLFEVAGMNNAKPSVKEYGTHLTVQQNIEGLCYDKKNNRLLLTVKDKEPGTHSYKGIYAFDLQGRQMPQDPVFKIDLGDKVFANEGSGKKKNKAGIMPSSIAIHPGTNDMYITDGRKAKLLVMNASGTIKRLYQLDQKAFSQPEGIAFTSNGDLFIANEGTKEPGNILNVVVSE